MIKSSLVVLWCLCFLFIIDDDGVLAKNVVPRDSKSSIVINNVRVKRTATAGATAGSEKKNCNGIAMLQKNWNFTMVPLPGSPKGSFCGGECCGNDAEAHLRKQVQKDFASLLRQYSRSLQGTLSFTAATLQNHIFELSHQSENKTLLLMSQIYQSMAVLSQSPTDELYSNIRNYILINTTKGSTPTATIDITNSVHQFFSKIFPLVFHQIHSNGKKDFTPDYKACLRKTIDTILPFGDIPKQISQSLSKSLEATRLLLQAFRIGNEVLNTTDRLLIDETGKSNSGCPNALLKMTYCPKCTGLINSKPCSGYCLNVLRGCLTKYVAELESPWNGYVDGMESLVNAIKRSNVDSGINADLVIRNLDTRISEAIMRAMERGLDIGNKVKRNCGPASFTEREDPLLTENSTSIPGSGKLRSVNPRVFAALPESQLLHFQTSIAKSRGFYGNLADTLCQDGSFAEPKDQRCWNGDRIAEYTKTVVDVGLDSQKYNPEVQQTTNTQSVDPQVAELVDKLRHVHHMAMSSVGSNSGNEVDYMQRDGVDGSGSGYGPDFEDGDDENTRGSGSGNGPIDPHQRSNSQPNNAGTKVEVGVSNPNTQSTPTAGGSRHSYKSSVLNWLSLCIVLLSARLTY